MRILRKVRKEFRYKEYVETYRTVKYTNNPSEVRICCPHPSCGDRHFKCYVNDNKKLFNCFKCDFSSRNYDVFDFVAYIEDISRGAAMMRLSAEYAEQAATWEEVVASLEPAFDDDETFHPVEISYIDHMLGEALTSPSVPKELPFWEYLFNRGLTEKEIRAAKIHYIQEDSFPYRGPDGKYRGDLGRRILIPVYGPAKKLVSWVARTIENREPKYFNCAQSDISKTFWPVVPPKDSSVILVEGVLDALAVRRAGKAAYATFGKKLSRSQIEILRTWQVEQVALFWDKRDAVADTKRAVEELKMYFNKVAVLDPGSGWPLEADAGDALKQPRLLELLREASYVDVNSVDYVRWLL